MADPVLTIRTHADPSVELAQALVFDDGEGGAVAKGADSSATLFRVYNDYGGTLGSVNAINVRVTAVDADSGNGYSLQTEEPVSNHWLHLSLISNNGISVSGTNQVIGSIDGTTSDDALDKAIYHSEPGHQTISSNAYLAFSAFMRIPSNASTGTHSFAIRIEYDYV